MNEVYLSRVALVGVCCASGSVLDLRAFVGVAAYAAAGDQLNLRSGLLAEHVVAGGVDCEDRRVHEILCSDGPY